MSTSLGSSCFQSRSLLYINGTNRNSENHITRKKKSKTRNKMSSTIVSISAESTLHLSLNSNRPYKKPAGGGDIFSGVSFSSHVSKSRISIGNSSGTRRARPATRIKALYAAAESRGTLYELLGITETGSSFSDIKKAYKQMARLYHPDVSPPERVDENTRKFIMVHEAYETLSDPRARALYDRDHLNTGLGFSFSATKSHKETEENEEWRRKWEVQLDELQQRDSSWGGMSWGARMRSQR